VKIAAFVYSSSFINIIWNGASYFAANDDTWLSFGYDETQLAISALQVIMGSLKCYMNSLQLPANNGSGFEGFGR
jgi:hypothetical protein